MNEQQIDLHQLREKLVDERNGGLSHYYMAKKMLEEADEKIKAASQKIQLIDATLNSGYSEELHGNQ